MILKRNLVLTPTMYGEIHDILFKGYNGKAQEIFIESRVVSIFAGGSERDRAGGDAAHAPTPLHSPRSTIYVDSRR